MSKIFHHTPKLDRYTSLGSYPLVYLQSGWVLCCECATQTKHNQRDPEWRRYATKDERAEIVADIYYEGPATECDECGSEIESAYGNPESES